MTAQPSRGISTADRFARNIFDYDFFISFKLGALAAGAQSYASDLSRRLRELDYPVFYSEEEAPSGAPLDATLVSAPRRSKFIVVIVSEGWLLKSIWIRKEVEQFRALALRLGKSSPSTSTTPSRHLDHEPCFYVVRAADEFKDKTTAPNQLWQTD